MRKPVVVLLALSGVLVACSETKTSGNGGTLVIAAPSDADNLVPPLTITGQGRQVVDQVFDYLADIGPGLNTVGDGGFTPRLADSWKWSSDSSSISFHIDPRARWHDGKRVTASDVRFTYKLVTDTALGSPIAGSLAGIDSVSVRDSSTAVVWYHSRTPEQFFDFVYNVAILPEHLLAGIAPKAVGSSQFARHPIGSGRFRFGRWDGGARIELVADSANYRGRPHLDRVVWLVSPDMGGATTRLLAGQADFLEVVRGATVQQVTSSPRLTLLEGPSLDYGYLGFNMKRAPFTDRNVRRALSMAVDRSALARNVFDTLAQPGIGPVVRALPSAGGVGEPVATDTAAARKFLVGRGIHFTILVPTSSAVRMKYATLLQEQFRAAGVTVKIEPLEVNAFAGRITKGDFDAMLNAWHTDPTPAAVTQAWGSNAAPPRGANFTRYSSAAFDSAVTAGSREFDPSKAALAYATAYRIIDADAPAIWLYESRSVSGVSRRIQTAGARPDAWWAGLADWRVVSR